VLGRTIQHLLVLVKDVVLQQEKVTVSSLEAAIAASQDYLLSIQNPAGYWWAELESNVTMTAEVVLLHKIWGTDRTRPLHKVESLSAFPAAGTRRLGTFLTEMEGA